MHQKPRVVCPQNFPRLLVAAPRPIRVHGQFRTDRHAQPLQRMPALDSATAPAAAAHGDIKAAHHRPPYDLFLILRCGVRDLYAAAATREDVRFSVEIPDGSPDHCLTLQATRAADLGCLRSASSAARRPGKARYPSMRRSCFSATTSPEPTQRSL